jgi:DNA-directed RNA polymerase subunit M/transcription elongation factor TFIIS
MNFCTKCDNMYYIKLNEEDENSLIYYCRKCGHEDPGFIANLDNVCVSKSDKMEESSYNHIVNRYTKLDPTLPRLYDIKCPNSKCISNTSGEEKKGEADDDIETTPEIIYLRYDDTNMRFVYICSLCDTVWKSTTNN